MISTTKSFSRSHKPRPIPHYIPVLYAVGPIRRVECRINTLISGGDEGGWGVIDKSSSRPYLAIEGIFLPIRV